MAYNTPIVPRAPRPGLILAAGAVALSGTLVNAGGIPTSPPTPIPRRVKGMEVALLGIRTGLSGRDLRSPAVGKEARWARIDLRLSQDGTPSRLWLPQGVEITTDRGTRLSPSKLTSYFHANGEGCLAFPDPRLANASEWKLRLEMARSPRYLPYEFWNVFRPEELWTIPRLPVPRRKAFSKASPHVSVVMREGVRLRLVQLAGARAGLGTAPKAKLNAPSIQVRYSPALTGLNVTLVRATDFKGRLLTQPTAPVAPPRAPGREERSVLFPVKTRPDSRLINATFAVHHSRFLDFIAAPEQATPGREVAAR